jgi:hypothetical protein
MQEKLAAVSKKNPHKAGFYVLRAISSASAHLGRLARPRVVALSI